MRRLITILFPWLSFFSMGRSFAGIMCLLLQITLLGWIPAALWSAYALSRYNIDKKIKYTLAAMSKNQDYYD